MERLELASMKVMSALMEFGTGLEIQMMILRNQRVNGFTFQLMMSITGVEKEIRQRKTISPTMILTRVVGK